AAMPRASVSFQLSQKKPSVRVDSSLTYASLIGLPFSSRTRTSARPIPLITFGAMPVLGGSLRFGSCEKARVKAARIIKETERIFDIKFCSWLMRDCANCLGRGRRGANQTGRERLYALRKSFGRLLMEKFFSDARQQNVTRLQYSARERN